MRLSNESYFSLNFIARKARINKEGETAIVLRITMNGQRAEIYTNRYIAPDNWNSAKGQAKGKTKKDLELNRYLDTLRAKIFEIHGQLVLRDEMITPDTLKRAFLGKMEKPMMLCEAFRTVNKKCATSLSAATSLRRLCFAGSVARNISVSFFCSIKAPRIFR